MEIEGYPRIRDIYMYMYIYIIYVYVNVYIYISSIDISPTINHN